MSEPLPLTVRALVVAVAVDTLAELADAEVPPSLVAVRRFTPTRRARLGAAPLAAALEADQVFRGRVAERIRLAMPDLVAVLEAGDRPPPAAPADEVAAIAYLLRLDGWESLVRAAGEEAARQAASVAAAESAGAVRRLTEQLEALRRTARAEAEQLRAQLAAGRVETEEARRRLRGSSERVRKVEAATAEAIQAADAARDEAVAAARDAEAEARRLRAKLADAEAVLSAARRGSREARTVDDVRLRVLLDTLSSAAAGVRRELALPPVVTRPADTAAGPIPVDPFAALGARGLPEDDPALLDEVLGVPLVHLIVDGYNVTKRGYGALPLEAQRARLLSGLATLPARAPDAEITCVFDATAVTSRPVATTAAPRGVRVVFSQPGQLADEEIARLVHAEPPGRPIAVVTSDREVADTVRRAGGRPVPSAALLARLDRA